MYRKLIWREIITKKIKEGNDGSGNKNCGGEMNIEEIKPAIYSNSASSDIDSISIFESILDKKSIIPHLNKIDKIPNYDGFLELVDNGVPIGKIEVQVKTLRKNYKNPSHPIELSTLAYAKDLQLPFLLVVVDQNKKKVFWKEINRENSILLINEALDKKDDQKSISVKFERNNEIPKHSPYSIWKTIVEEHKRLIHNSREISKELVLSKEELEKLKLKLKIREQDQSPKYVQMHMFLDTLNNLFSNEFKIIKNLFVSDFWKFGIVTFGKISESRIAYSLFPIGWNENLKQINAYQESNDFQKFISNYPSVTAHSGKNPILATPVKYAYEKFWEYLKLVLDKDRNLIWPNNQYLQQEFLFYLKDTQFRNHKIEDVKTLDLVSFKEEIEIHLTLIPESKKQLMKEFPEMNDNLFRALDYIQNFRIEEKKSINRLSPSKRSIQNIAISVGEKGVFPKDIEATLFDYWNTLLNSYENVLEEFFPLVKEELSNNNFTYIIIPFIDASSFNDRAFNIAYLTVLKFNNENRKTNRKIFIEMNEANVKLDYRNRTVLYDGKKYKYSIYEIERVSISSLSDDNMPIRKGVYNLLTKNLKSYFEKITEKRI